MSNRVWRWCAMVAVVGATVASPVLWAETGADQTPAPEAQLTTVEQVRSAVLDSLLKGQFEQTGQMLRQAADQSADPTVDRMASWLDQFEQQRQIFTSERREQYAKAVADVHKLLDAGHESYAIDLARSAYLLADDKAAFRKEAWVDALVTRSTQLAEQAEQEGNWLRALRLYSDLGAIEPANPLWKDKLKLATRRIRLVGLYTPDDLKSLQEREIADREPVDELLKPTTQPTTQPATTQPALDRNLDDSFRVNWQDTLKGIKMDMLEEALDDARNHYYRNIAYRDLLVGGLKGLQVLSSTTGLSAAFPGLSDQPQREAFQALLGDLLRQAEMATASTEMMLLRSSLRKIKSANAETIKLPEEVLVAEFADGAFAELDAFSSMIWPSDLEEFNKSTQGEFSGVGISIQSDEDGSLKVVSPLEDSPAYNAGVKAGDIIERIDGKNAKGITLNQAVKTITGPPGTKVTLTIRSEDGTVTDYNLTRQTIKVASVKGWKHLPGGGWDYYVDPQEKIAYLRLTNFTKTTGEELEQALRAMQHSGAEALILDLRYNPGGLLQAAIEVSDKFLREGTIVSTRADRETPNHPTEAVANDNDDREFKLPVVVLVNQYSASASEIVAGALKDLDRALVVGERTFGKGSVQMLFPLPGRQAFLKLTTSHYYLPSGRCIHREENSETWGVDPDLVIEMTPEQMKAAIDARQELDVLRNANAAPAEDQQRKMQDTNLEVEGAVEEAIAQTEKKDPLTSDPQLGAALLLLRMQLTGETQLSQS